MKIILIGCGGTGVELLKIIGSDEMILDDMLLVDDDRISLSNLHRLFMFGRGDIGKYKSVRAAEFMNERYGCAAKWCIQRIEDVPIDVLNQYDVMIGAIDNVEGRMNMNLMFKRSRCKVLIDCGVSGYRAHAKIVRNDLSCLYCIKELYKEEGMMNMCSLRSIPEEITSRNKESVLRSLIELEREKSGSKDEKIERIVNEFNGVVNDELRTSVFDVMGMYDDVIPNVCFINSICAGLVYELLNNTDKSYDFIFYNGEEGISFRRLMLEKDDGCIVCNLE